MKRSIAASSSMLALVLSTSALAQGPAGGNPKPMPRAPAAMASAPGDASAR